MFYYCQANTNKITLPLKLYGNDLLLAKRTNYFLRKEIEMQTLQEQIAEKLKAVFKTGEKYKVFTIGESLAFTCCNEITVNEHTDRGIVFTPKGKRKRFIIPFIKSNGQPFAGAVFAGWEQPIYCDTDKQNGKSDGMFTSQKMRGNACFNFVGKPEAIKQWIETKQLNPFFEKTKTVAIDGDKEIVVFADEYTGGHAIIDRMLAAQEEAA